MGRGPRRGGRKRFTDFKTLEKEAKSIKERKEREANGEEVTSSDEEERNEEESDSYESESDSSSSEDERGRQKPKKGKGVEGLIEVNNPNFKQKKNIKARDLDMNAEVTLTRREREALEAQRAKERYFKLQKEGKTEQARKDLDRLAIVRKQREEAAKKRAEEKAKKEAGKKK